MLFKQLRDMISSLSCHADTILDHIEKLEIVGTCSYEPSQTYPYYSVIVYKEKEMTLLVIPNPAVAKLRNPV